MFLNISKLKSYLKKVYKGVAGIGMEHSEDGVLVVQAGRLYIEADLQKATKEFKAALIEICGEIPQAGVAREYNEDGEQETIPDAYNMHIMQHDYMQGKPFAISDIRIDGNLLFQSPMDYEILMIKEKLVDIYAPQKVEEYESSPKDWNYFDDLLVCGNGNMILAYKLTDPDNEYHLMDILKALHSVYIINDKMAGDKI